MAEGSDLGEGGLRRKEAIAAFNRAWELIDSHDRSPADGYEMLGAAFASRYLWESVGGDEQRAVGDWQIAHVASLLGLSDIALCWANQALERVNQNGWTDWRLASCYEGMARAHAAAGDGAQYRHWAELARRAIDGIEDEEDRELIASQLASIPPVTALDGDEGAEGARHSVLRLDHVQLAMPAGLEAEADAFYEGILGLSAKAKPPALAARGGRWFENESVKLHLGVDTGFRPATKAHPALIVESLEHLAAELAKAGHPPSWDSELAGVRRCFVSDPFGNRIELIEA